MSAFYGCSALKIFDWPSELVQIYASAFKHCSSLKSYVFPHKISIYGETCFQYAFAPEYYDEDDLGVFDLHLSAGATFIDGQAFHGYNSLTGIPRKIHRLYLGDETNSVGEFGTQPYIVSGAFNSTPIDYVVIYCNTEDHGSWTDTNTGAPSIFTTVTNGTKSFVFPN